MIVACVAAICNAMSSFSLQNANIPTYIYVYTSVPYTKKYHCDDIRHRHGHFCARHKVRMGLYAYRALIRTCSGQALVCLVRRAQK